MKTNRVHIHETHKAIVIREMALKELKSLDSLDTRPSAETADNIPTSCERGTFANGKASAWRAGIYLIYLGSYQLGYSLGTKVSGYHIHAFPPKTLNLFLFPPPLVGIIFISPLCLASAMGAIFIFSQCQSAPECHCLLEGNFHMRLDHKILKIP